MPVCDSQFWEQYTGSFFKLAKFELSIKMREIDQNFSKALPRFCMTKKKSRRSTLVKTEKKNNQTSSVVKKKQFDIW